MRRTTGRAPRLTGMSDGRSFPVMQIPEHVREIPTPIRLHRIPWVAIEGHAKQVEINHHSTVERLAERGGLSPKEILAVLRDVRWHEVKETKPIEIEQAVLNLCLRAVIEAKRQGGSGR